MYLPSRKACKFFGVCANTLRAWANAGKIKYIKTPAGQRLFDCSEFEKQNTNYKKSYCYCRVSSYKQKDDLERQKEYLQKKYPNHIIVSDIGSGLNFKRKLNAAALPEHNILQLFSLILCSVLYLVSLMQLLPLYLVVLPLIPIPSQSSPLKNPSNLHFFKYIASLYHCLVTPLPLQ